MFNNIFKFSDTVYIASILCSFSIDKAECSFFHGHMCIEQFTGFCMTTYLLSTMSILSYNYGNH